MDQKKLNRILKLHKLWLNKNEEGNKANLSNTDLSNTDLSNTNLRGADLRGANLRDTNLRDTNLSNADLRGANLSGVKGLLNQAKWIKKNFKSDKKGIYVYKAFGDTEYDQNCFGRIRVGRIIKEEVNYNRASLCACGVNVATLKWIQHYYGLDNKRIKVYRCLIKWEDLINCVVPYNTDGKFRCAKLTIIKKMY